MSDKYSDNAHQDCFPHITGKSNKRPNHVPQQTMADFLTAVKTVHNQADAPQEPALTERSSQRTRNAGQDASVKEKHIGAATAEPRELVTRQASATSPEEALRILRSQPDTETLIGTLRQLSPKDEFGTSFSLAATGPLQAQIINTLLNSIIPTFWSTLEEKHEVLLLDCLRNVAGLNAVVAKLRSLSSTSPNKGDGNSQQLLGLRDVTDHIFYRHTDDFAHELWTGLEAAISDLVKRQLAWKEAVNLLGSGKVIAAAAQAEDAARTQATAGRMAASWLSNGAEYSTWLGKNIARLLTGRDAIADVGSPEAAAKLLGKALNLGYPGSLIEGLVTNLVEDKLDSTEEHSRFAALIEHVPAYAKRQLLDQIMRWLSSLVPSNSAPHEWKDVKSTTEVHAIAALLKSVIQSEIPMQQNVGTALTDPVLSTSLSSSVRRACLATLSVTAADDLQPLLEKIMTTFGDPLFINHAPIVQQESLAQSLLLTAGYLHRHIPMAVLMTAHSSSHMQGVSNRLDTSSQRARWLGMVVATALSSVVDKVGSRMNFDVDEMRTEEAKWYLQLVNVQDKVGTLQEFHSILKARKGALKPAKAPHRPPKAPGALPTLNGKPIFGPPRPPAPTPIQTEVIGEKVSELIDEVSSEEDELKPHAKPDSDPEDSDEDATLVNRNKPRAPVYVRDLMAMLGDDKNSDRFQLGIKHTASLVRRKANFGNEVKDHAEELLRMLCNLQDPFSVDDFDALRLQAMIAVLLSDVQTLGPWLSSQAFAGEYSLAHRCVMLTALGLGGRELAGIKNEDDLNPVLSNTDFPTKRLPSRLHSVYSPANPSIKRLEAASKGLEHQLIQPMALQAADQSTAHLNAVKVRTFSSRLAVEQRTKRKPAANQLAKVFGPAFFFPLVGRYQQEVSAYGSGSVFVSAPFLAVTLLKTLALLLHASGPATLSLSQVTEEFWELLLSLRVQAVGDITVLEAVLFSLLTLLEVNTDKRRIAEEHPKQLMETQQWAELVFERAGGGELPTGGGGEEAKVRTLAAGVLVKTREVVEAYQKQLFGHVIE